MDIHPILVLLPSYNPPLSPLLESRLGSVSKLGWTFVTRDDPVFARDWLVGGALSMGTLPTPHTRFIDS